MGKILGRDSYGLINKTVFTSIDFSNCENNTTLSALEVERKLYRLTEVAIISEVDVEVDGKKYDLYSTALKYKGKEFEINFVVEIKKGILYVLSVSVVFNLE